MSSHQPNTTVTVATSELVDIEELLLATGPETFKKGVLLMRQNKISQLKHQGNTASATVKGTLNYQVTLNLQPQLQCRCTCPAAEYMPICKHAVAVALLLNSQPAPSMEATSDEQILRRYFGEKSPAELLELLLGQLERDDLQWRHWLLKAKLAQTGITLADLKKMVTKALPARQLWAWKEVSNYFSDAEQQLESLWDAMTQLPIDEQWLLVDHVLQRLNKVLGQIDDSGGFRFGIEGQISQLMPELFMELSWPAMQKAQWLFDHLDPQDYDVFPDINEFFTATGEVETCLLCLCRQALEPMVAGLIPGQRPEHWWRMKRYADPLLKAARATDNWREELRVRAMLAYSCDDFLDLARLCLDHQEELDAEDWLIRARKVANVNQQPRCLEMEIRIRIALGETAQAWQLAWHSFERAPSFRAFTQLQELHEELGQPEPDLLSKVERLFANPTTQHQRDAQCEFYLSIGNAEAAKRCARVGLIGMDLLPKVADAVVATDPAESLALYLRVIRKLLEQSDNRIYQQVLQLLQQLQRQLTQHQLPLVAFEQAVNALAIEFRRKRNFTALISKHFPYSF